MEMRELCRQIRQLIILFLSELPKETSLHAVNVAALITLLSIVEEREKSIGDGVINQENTQVFIDFFFARWNRIIGTDLIYPHAPNELLNSICIAIAERLEPIFNKSRFVLLMPTITVLQDEISTLDLRETNLAITDFVLSDQSDRVIEVSACLEYAQEDGLLKHNSLFDGQVRPLSVSEARRVVYHSVESCQLYFAIINRIKVTQQGHSAGANLMMLINSLDEGGVHARNGGSEWNAGQYANEGIHKFSRWLELLSSTDKEKIFECVAPGLSETIGQIWDRLARPNDVNYRNSVYCVEIIAGNLRQVLGVNKWLFNFIPSMSVESQQRSIELLDEDYLHRKQELANVLKSGLCIVNATYGKTARERLIKIELKADECHHFLKHDVLSRVEPEIQTRLQFELLMHAARHASAISDNLYRRILLTSLQDHSVMWASVADTYDNLYRILSDMPSFCRLGLIRVLPSSGQGLILDINQFIHVLRLLDEADQVAFININEELLVQSIRADSNALSKILCNCAPENRWPLLDYLMKHYAVLMSRPGLLFAQLVLLPKDDCELFLMDVYHQLPDIINNIRELPYVLSLLGDANDMSIGDDEDDLADGNTGPDRKVEKTGDVLSQSSVMSSRVIKIYEFMKMMMPQLERLVRSVEDYNILLVMLPEEINQGVFSEMFPEFANVINQQIMRFQDSHRFFSRPSSPQQNNGNANQHPPVPDRELLESSRPGECVLC